MTHSPVIASDLPTPVGPYSPGMQFERLIFVSGQGATDPATGELWGNYPQTYSLVGMINCAALLSKPWSSVR